MFIRRPGTRNVHHAVHSRVFEMPVVERGREKNRTRNRGKLGWEGDGTRTSLLDEQMDISSNSCPTQGSEPRARCEDPLQELEVV